MSRINFDTIAARHPELEVTWRRLADWFRANPHVTTVSSIAVARSMPEDSPRSLSRALFYLVDEGQLQQLYQLVAPNGLLVGPVFDSPEVALPRTVRGRFDEPVPTDDCLLVPVFRVPSTEESAGE